MLVKGLGESGKTAHDRGFRLFRSVTSYGADRCFIAFDHVGIGIPKPLDGPGCLDKGDSHLTFQERRLALGRASSDLIRIQFSLQSRLLDQQWLSRLLGQKRIPQQKIVLPPGMVGGEVDKTAPKSR